MHQQYGGIYETAERLSRRCARFPKEPLTMYSLPIYQRDEAGDEKD
jgi:hypothetical protein